MNKKKDNEARGKQIKKLIETGTKEDKQVIEHAREEGRELRNVAEVL